MFAWYSVFVLFLPLVKSIIFDSHIQPPLVEEEPHLKVIFPGGDEEYVQNWECPEGIWAEEMHLKRQPNCVCVKGVYAIGTNLCDTEFKILAGDNHCFDVRGQTIRKLIPLTGKRGFNGRANTVFRADAPYFARLNSPTPTTSVSEPVHFLFRMNDPLEFTVYARTGNGQAAKLKCLQGQDVLDNFTANPVMQIARLPNCSNEFRGPKSWCEDASFQLDYQWTFMVGQSWSSTGSITAGDKYPSNCKTDGEGKGGSDKDKKPVPKKGRKKRWAQTAKKPKKPNQKPGKGVSGRVEVLSAVAVAQIGKQQCDRFDDTLIEKDDYELPALEHFYQPNPTKVKPKFHTASIHQKEVSNQNRRVGHHLRNFFLNGDQRVENAPRLKDFDEYKYVQISKEILKAVCPVQGYVVDFLVRAFRLIYIDSSPGYPYPIKSNKHEHGRIKAALDKCKADALPIEFIRNTSCPDVGILATNQSLNESVFVVHELNNTNASYIMPGDVSFNITSMDMAVELIWKITMLTHYYCFDKFRANPIDLSLFFVKMEAFLKNPAILFRWYYPGQFNAMLQFFLMQYDLGLFANMVDRCVETVFAQSKYKEWLKRPAEVMGRGSRLKTDTNTDNYEAPISPISNFGKDRKKRYYLQDDMWQKQAYCMHVTDAPYTEVRTNTFLSCSLKPAWFDNTDG